MILVFTGIQGSGKGTQARLLAENYDFKLLEMGQELRKIIASSSDLGKRIKGDMEAGILLSPEIVGEVMKEVIGEQTGLDLILDGFVRNAGNKVSLEAIVPNYKVVYFDLSREKAIERLLGRMIDPDTGETFPSGTNFNPETGKELVKRHDDNEKSILKRIDEFVAQTLPIVEVDRQEGRVVEINADQDVEEVYKELVKKLEL